VVVTGSEEIRLAPLVVSIQVTSDKTTALEEVPSTTEVSSVASITTSESTAGKKVFGRDSCLEFLA
jgi:hypothetical protein